MSLLLNKSHVFIFSHQIPSPADPKSDNNNLRDYFIFLVVRDIERLSHVNSEECEPVALGHPPHSLAVVLNPWQAGTQG